MAGISEALGLPGAGAEHLGSAVRRRDAGVRLDGPVAADTADAPIWSAGLLFKSSHPHSRVFRSSATLCTS